MLETEKYAEWMKQEVEPFLKKHGQSGFMWSRDGTAIHYKLYRLEKAPKCVVISHGFSEFAEKYNELIYTFMQMGYSVYIPEHRGHGYSERAVKDMELVHVQNYKKYVEDFVQFVECVVAPVEKHRILFAHSMGGAIAGLTIEQYPYLFEAAIFSAPMCGIRTGRLSYWEARILAGFYCMIGKGKSYAAAAGQGRFQEKPDFPGSSCMSEARYRYVFEKRREDKHYRTNGGSYGWVYAGLRACGKFMKKKNLARIDIPVLLFAAGNDHMVKNEDIRRFVTGTRKTKFVFMQEAKHEIFNGDDETCRKFYNEIRYFLEGEEEKEHEDENEQIGKILGVI